MMGVTDLLGPGGPNLKVETPFLVSVFLACQVALYLLASLHAQKKFFLGHPTGAVPPNARQVLGWGKGSKCFAEMFRIIFHSFLLGDNRAVAVLPLRKVRHCLTHDGRD